jgi:hypothetical protein
MCSSVESRYYDSGNMDFSGTDDEYAEFVKAAFEGAYIQDGFCRVNNPTYPIKN